MAELIAGTHRASRVALRGGMAELIADNPRRAVSENLARPRADRLAAAARTGPLRGAGAGRHQVRASEDLPALAEAGIWLVGENRAQDLQEKVAAHGELFAWHFIGQLQSRRVPLIVPHVRLIHSLASESALHALERHRDAARARGWRC